MGIIITIALISWGVGLWWHFSDTVAWVVMIAFVLSLIILIVTVAKSTDLS